MVDKRFSQLWLFLVVAAGDRPKQETIEDVAPSTVLTNNLQSSIEQDGTQTTNETKGEQTKSCTFGGYFTPTGFARADTPHNKKKKWEPSTVKDPTTTNNMKEGRSDIMSAESISEKFGDILDNKIPWQPDKHHKQFLSVMEAQWEGRDTQNANDADAVIGFLIWTEDETIRQDGSKSTLNMFAQGRYAHPLKESPNEFNFGLPNVTKLNKNDHVGYKLLKPNNVDAFDYRNQWKDSSNGRFNDVPTIGPDEEAWTASMQNLAEQQYEIGQRNTPILAIWLSKDGTSSEDLADLKDVTTKFLAYYQPKRLMFTGKRDDQIASDAHDIMEQALKTRTSNIHLITGFADGVDSIALDILNCVAGS